MKRRKFREIEVHNEATLKRNKQNKEIKYTQERQQHLCKETVKIIQKLTQEERQLCEKKTKNKKKKT